MRFRRLSPAARRAGCQQKPVALFDPEQLDVEQQRRVRRDDTAGAARTVAESRRNDQRTLAADLHGGDAFVPALNHVALADSEFEWLVAIDRRIEFLAFHAPLVEPAGVIHDAGLAGLRRSAGAGFDIDDLQSIGHSDDVSLSVS